MVRGAVSFFILVFAIDGCQRPIPIQESPTIRGYEVQGTVTDQLGNPIPDVQVFVDYSCETIYTDSSLTRTYIVTDPSATVSANVVDWSGRVVRVLAGPRQHSGPYTALWDGTDSTGAVPPSGIYYVQYLVNGAVRFTYGQLVSGGRVATTDAQGFYTIPLQNLPIDSSSVPLFSQYDSSYVGNLLVTNYVALTYTYPNHFQQIGRSLDNGQVSIVNVIFH